MTTISFSEPLRSTFLGLYLAMLFCSGWVSSGFCSVENLPAVMQELPTEIRLPDHGLRIGSVFTTEHIFQAEPGVRWSILETPIRYDRFTLRRVTILPEERSSSYLAELEWQVFQVGRLDLPAVVLEGTTTKGHILTVNLKSGSVESQSLFGEEDPASIGPRPPRYLPFNASARTFLPWLAGLLVLLLLLGGRMVFRLFRRQPNEETAVKEEVEHSARYFISQLEDCWISRKRVTDHRVITGRMLLLMREYLSWRFTLELQGCTNNEISVRVREEGKMDEPEAEHLTRILETANHVRFAPDGALGSSWYEQLVAFVEKYGDRPFEEKVNNGSDNS